MSDPIETGARRHLQSLVRPRTQSIGKRRTLGPSRDELELAADRFSATAIDDAAPGRQARSRMPAEDEANIGRLARAARKAAQLAKAIKKNIKLRARKNAEVDLGRIAGKTQNTAKSATATTLHFPEKLQVAGRKRRRVVSNNAEPTRTSTPRASGKPEVVSPKRRRAITKDTEQQRRPMGAELKIASTRDMSNDIEPSRPRPERRSRPDSYNVKSQIGPGTLVLLGVLLIALTAATFLLMPRYETLDRPLISEKAFDGELAEWTQAGDISKTNGDPTGVILRNNDNARTTYLTRDIKLPSGKTLLMLRAEVQGQDVRQGIEDWDQARIYLVRISAGGDALWGEDHNLFLLNGTTDIRNYSRAYSIPEEITTARLGIELKNASGQLTVNKLTLEVAQRPMPFMLATGWLVIGWGFLITYSAIQVLKGIQSNGIRLCLGIALVLSILALFIPGYIYEDPLRDATGRFGAGSLDISSLGHGVMFAVLALLMRLGRPFDQLWMHACVWPLIALASEVLQIFTADREPSVIDFFLDGAGLLIGLALAEIRSLVRSFRVA